MCSHGEDVHAAWEHPASAGAEVIYPLEDQSHQERGGRLGGRSASNI
jgi:uncharacterized glyoxalase superfamily protein PhnB